MQIRDLTGTLTGEEWYVRAIEAKGWHLTIWEAGKGLFVAEIHDARIDGNNGDDDAYHGPIAAFIARTPTRAARNAYMAAIGEIPSWSPPRLDDAPDAE